jgi:hypothetical protein
MNEILRQKKYIDIDIFNRSFVIAFSTYFINVNNIP